MISISFNSDMDEYLSRRNRQVAVKPVEAKPIKKNFGEEVVTMDEEKECTEKKKGFFSRIKEWFSFDEETAEKSDVPEQKEDFREDMKEILKIQNKWLKRMPSDAIKEFKVSDDFKRYKELLEKHSLIKKD